jgi:hypothetical protein
MLDASGQGTGALGSFLGHLLGRCADDGLDQVVAGQTSSSRSATSTSTIWPAVVLGDAELLAGEMVSVLAPRRLIQSSPVRRSASVERSSAGAASSARVAKRSAGVQRPSAWCGRSVLYPAIQPS